MNKYSIGLDIGTNSVGWSVVNSQSEIKRFRKQSMHGVRKTNGAKTAEERRTHRSSRRRLERKKYRIQLLQELFDPLIHEVDPGFFQRLQYSYKNEPGENTYNIFVEKSFNDQTYLQQYPTIYHLRRELIHDKKEKDIRLVYLVIHHMIKHRGHFIYEGQSFNVSDTGKIEGTLTDIFMKFNTSAESLSEISNVLKDSQLTRSDKREKIYEILNIKTQSRELIEPLKAIVGSILNYSVNLNHLIGDYDFEKKQTISEIFNDESPDVFDTVSSKISEEELEFLEKIHEVFSWLMMQDVLMGKKTLSDAKVAAYKKHEVELRLTKRLLKKYNNKAFKEIFKSKVGKCYETYLNNTSNFDLESLNKIILNAFKGAKIESTDMKDYHLIVKELEQVRLLKKLKTKENASIPYQLNMTELEQIIDNQGEFYPLLKENKKRLLQLLSFKIPYFVGPLNDRSEFSTAVRKSNEIITPWNFDSVIDLEESAIKFIRVRTSRCTYLSDELVLPKKSIITQDYEVLNELNGIRVNGHKLSVGLKQRIFNGLFLEKSKVSESNLRKWLEVNQELPGIQAAEITGFQKDKEFSTSRSSSILFLKYFDNMIDNREMIEEIILWITTIKDKKLLFEKLKKEYSNLDEKVLDELRKQNFDGWSRLSSKFLNEIKSTDKEHETIIEKLYNTNEVLMQIINKKEYGFKKIIEENQTKNVKLGKITYDDVQALATSPAVKQQIWQTFKLVEEIVSIEKNLPENIFLEFAREEVEKRRTTSRHKTLETVYSRLAQENSEFKKSELFKSLKGMNETDLSNERLFLYFVQKGKCLYTGANLDINNLSSYEVDHIIPQSLVKNNSFDNKALVTTEANQIKGGRLGVDISIIRNQTPFWIHLKERNLMSQSKFNSLTREYNERNRDEYVNSFINRQLVETRQITKHVVALLKAAYPDTNVVAIRANMLSDLRSQYNFFKCRNVNDFHHAKDAYLTAIFGQFMSVRFPNLLNIDDKPKYSINLSKNNKNGFLIGEFSKFNKIEENGEVLWSGEYRVKTMIEMMNRNDVLVTHQLVEEKGQFYNQTIVPINDKSNKRFPVNKERSDTNLYGGYTSEKNSYMSIIEITEIKKNKEIITKKLINIPIRVRNNFNEYIEEYRKENSYKEIKVINSKVMLNQLIRVDGALVRLSSASEWANAQQLIMPNHLQEALMNLERKMTNYIFTNEELNSIYESYAERLREQYPHYSGYLNKIEENNNKFINLDIESKKEILNKMLIASKASKSYTAINVSGINLGAACGRLYNKNLSFNECSFINQSITGLFVSVTKQ